MKKSIKMLAVGMAVVPCALVLTACGGGNAALVDTKGNYSEVEVASYETVIGDLDEKGFSFETIVSGTRLVLSMDADFTVMGETMKITAKSDTYVKNYAQEGKLEADKFESINNNDLTMTMNSNSGNLNIKANAKQYVKEGVQYIDLTGAEDFLTMMGYTQMVPALKFSNSLVTGDAETDVVDMPAYTMTDIAAMVPTESWGEDFVISTYEKGNDYKVKVTVNGTYLQGVIEGVLTPSETEEMPEFTIDQMGDVTIYIVYSEGNLVGVNVSTNVDLSFEMQMDETTSIPYTVKVKLGLDVLPYDGELAFPTDLNATNYPLQELNNGAEG